MDFILGQLDGNLSPANRWISFVVDRVDTVDTLEPVDSFPDSAPSAWIRKSA
jgi:hypothetical protein